MSCIEFGVSGTTPSELLLHPGTIRTSRCKYTRSSLGIKDRKSPPWVRRRLQFEGGVSQKTSSSKKSPTKHVEDRDAFLELIKSCGKQKKLCKARKAHADVLRKKLFPQDASIGASLLQMYTECGAIDEAQNVFDQLTERGAESWSLLIRGYAQHGYDEKALDCFKKMQNESVRPDEITFTSILKACSSTRSIQVGEEIHAEFKKQGLLKKNIVLGTVLIDMYAKCGVLEKAREVFEELPVRDVVSWSVLIAGYNKYGLDDEALNCYKQMQNEGISPDAITFVSVLKACSGIRSLQNGEEIHAEIRKQRLLRKNTVLGTTLLDMYIKCGALEKAQEVFDELLIRDVVSWSALMAGYVEYGQAEEALSFFQRMQDEGILPDVFTFTCVLKACSSIGSPKIGKRIYAVIRRLGMLKENAVLGTTLVDMYAKCGLISKAQEVFHELPVRDVVSWSALMDAYIQHGLSDEALNCFQQMRNEGISPNVITFTCILKACSSIGSLELGEEIHAEITKQGFLRNETTLGNTLVDMYNKCGVVIKAQEVFEKIPVRDVVSWNALLAGYAQLGHAKTVFILFGKMIAEGIIPDPVTFIALLASCSHAGLLEEGQDVFNDMSTIYSLAPTVEHYTCMVDLFSRAGHFDKAAILCENLLSGDRLQLLLVLLSACQKWVNVEHGRWAFEQLLQIDETCASAYVFMGNIYIAAGLNMEADRIEALREREMKSGMCPDVADGHMFGIYIPSL